MKWNDDDDDDQIIQMNRRQHQSAMLILLNKEELCSLSCAKNISIEDYFCFFFSVPTTMPTTTPAGNWNRIHGDSDDVKIKPGSLDRHQFELHARKCLVCLVQRLSGWNHFSFNFNVFRAYNHASHDNDAWR